MYKRRKVMIAEELLEESPRLYLAMFLTLIGDAGIPLKKVSNQVIKKAHIRSPADLKRFKSDTKGTKHPDYNALMKMIDKKVRKVA